MVISTRNRQLRITLSAAEICDYFGSYKNIRPDSVQARAAMGSILKTASAGTGLNFGGEKLTVRVFPSASGGCTICFTPDFEKTEYAFFEFADCEDMLLACEQLCRQTNKNMRISIFQKDGKYRIITNGKIPDGAFMLLSAEYAEKTLKSREDAEKTKEYWHCVCANTPIGQIINF